MLYAAFRIATDADIGKFQELFEQGNYLHFGTHIKPSSQQVLVSLANVTFYITKIRSIPHLLYNVFSAFLLSAVLSIVKAY